MHKAVIAIVQPAQEGSYNSAVVLSATKHWKVRSNRLYAYDHLRYNASVCEALQERQQGRRLIRLLKSCQQSALSQLMVVVRSIQRPQAAHRLIKVLAGFILLQQCLRRVRDLQVSEYVPGSCRPKWDITWEGGCVLHCHALSSASPWLPHRLCLIMMRVMGMRLQHIP